MASLVIARMHQQRLSEKKSCKSSKCWKKAAKKACHIATITSSLPKTRILFLLRHESYCYSSSSSSFSLLICILAKQQSSIVPWRLLLPDIHHYHLQTFKPHDVKLLVYQVEWLKVECCHHYKITTSLSQHVKCFATHIKIFFHLIFTNVKNT
jgi:hypothetical protein